MKLHILYPLLCAWVIVIVLMVTVLWDDDPYKQPQYTIKCVAGYMFVVDKKGVHQIIDMSGNGLPCIEEKE